jgi:thiamine pyrophosphate-dependent acetolactate synthase large subunit-like protein
LTKLAELIGAAVITSQSGKGSIPEDHPQCIGHFAAYEDVKKLLQESDLLISVGVRFRGNETANWKVAAPEAHVSIDADWNAFNRNYEITHGLLGEAKPILSALNEALAAQGATPDAEYVAEVKAVREKIRGILRDTLGPYENSWTACAKCCRKTPSWCATSPFLQTSGAAGCLKFTSLAHPSTPLAAELAKACRQRSERRWGAWTGSSF